MEDELVLIAQPDLEFNSLSRDQLLGCTLLLREFGSGSRHVVETALERAGFMLKSFKNVIDLDSTEAIKSAVEAGLGVAFVSCFAIHKEIELRALKIVEVEGLRVTRHYLVASRVGPEPSGIAGAFRSFALDRARHLSKSHENTHHSNASSR